MKKYFIIAVFSILVFLTLPVSAQENDITLCEKGTKLNNDRKSAEAIECFDKAIKQNPKNDKGSESVDEKNQKYLRYVLLLKSVKKLNPELINEHVAYMKSLHEKGVLELCGPFADEQQGGMVIIKAASIEEARKIAEKDPFIKNGCDSYEVRKWLIGSKENNFLQ